MKKVVLVSTAVVIALLSGLFLLNLFTKTHLTTEVVINAPAAKTWQVLTDLKGYETWNPFIISSKGEAIEGTQLTNTMLNKGTENVFSPVVTKAVPEKEFEWLGSGAMGMFKGRHYFVLEAVGDGQTRLRHGEKFSGLLCGLVLQLIGEETLRNFHKMNEALKAVAER